MSDQNRRPGWPFRLDLEQQRTRAKELLRALRAGDPEAVARLREHHPNATTTIAADGPPRLADAQLVIARELGSPSWARLKTHITALRRAQDAIERTLNHGAPPPDAGPRTLHLRCGSDIRSTLAGAGFVGDFLEHSDPCAFGPVPEGDGLSAIRARFIVEADDGLSDWVTEAAIAGKMAREEEGLARAARDYERVVLWCEHDSYDQLALARWLARFHETGSPALLEMVAISHFPGAARFIGLGQLPPEAIRMLWSTRRPVAAPALAAGRRVWNALRRDDPSELAAIARSTPEGLPDMPGALRRHLQELPWTGDGLSLTERIVLQSLAEEELTVGQAFARLMRQRDPLPWLGDLMFLWIVRAMAKAGEPPLAILDQETDQPWPRWRLAITQAGRALLRGERDGLSLAPPVRWVGGVRVAPGVPGWRWNDADARVERR
ncbi:DUF1835 domain-containing protein [Azospirillum agricola]|uniref:DUF1835 domain-containing protein n=1 Tax=Azospirillum agricola TaxID=1720247 RepID=UPI000A0EED0A|nr:hypothetical protein [Azospirillum agricola]SMH47490.1 hypothetical protein SAMN02982994_2600 [Azospirillum lipoferum]